LRTRAVVSILGVSATALISGFILWGMLFGGKDVTSFGLGGMFLVSMLSHLTMVARDIFVPLFIQLTPLYHPILLGLVAGVGGAIGDVSAYALGWGVSESFGGKSKTDDLVGRWVNRHGLWAVLIVAATPLPDLPVVMLAGSKRLPFRKLLVAEAAGKVAWYSVGALFGGSVFEALTGAVGSLTASALVVVASVAFTFLITWGPSRDYIFGLIEKFIPSGGG
jgi:membrane protein YqaA with SNARE-associated domain